MQDADVLRMTFHLVLKEDWPLVETEFLAVTGLDERTFRLEEVPVFVRNLNRLDFVSGEWIDGILTFREVAEHRGNSTLRMILMEEDDPQRVIDELAKLGCQAAVTRFKSLLTVEFPETVDYYEEIKGALDAGRDVDRWDYEEASICCGDDECHEG